MFCPINLTAAVIPAGLLISLSAGSLSAQAVVRNDEQTFGPTQARSTMNVHALNQRLDTRTMIGQSANVPSRYQCQSSLQSSGTVALFGGSAQIASVRALAIARPGRGNAPAAHYSTLQIRPVTLTSAQLHIKGQLVQFQHHNTQCTLSGYHFRPILQRSAWHVVGTTIVDLTGRMSSSASLNVSARAISNPGRSPRQPSEQAMVVGRATLGATGIMSARIVFGSGPVQVIESQMRPALTDVRPSFGASDHGLFGQLQRLAMSLILKVRVRNSSIFPSITQTLFDAIATIPQRTLQMK